jgi:hypothetical protein
MPYVISATACGKKATSIAIVAGYLFSKGNSWESSGLTICNSALFSSSIPRDFGRPTFLRFRLFSMTSHFSLLFLFFMQQIFEFETQARAITIK